MAWQLANRVKDAGIEVYVVGLSVCGADDGKTAADPGYCDGIGDQAHDNLADQRLLKCIASSPDHYYPVPEAQDLTRVFAEIAGKIAGRGLLR
jgi:predicted alpha/beta hydrolase family esterase